MDRDDITKKENQVKEKIALKDRIDELEKLASDRKKAHKLLKIQYELGQSLYSDLDFDEILELCFEAALEASGMDCGGLYIIDEKTGDLDLAYYKGLNPDFIEKNSHFDADSPNAKLIKQGKPLYTLHKELSKELERPELKEKIKAIAVIPIKYEGKVIACLNIASHTLEEFTDFSKAALEAMATQVGLVIIKSKMTQNIMESEAHFRMLIENSSDIITIMNPDGTITYESPSVEKILGYHPDELVGKNSIDFIHPDDAGMIAENLTKAMKEKGDNKTLTFRFLHKNGNWRTLEGIGKSVFNKGQIQIITNCRDITERRQAETSLRESENRFQIFLDSIKDVVWTAKLDGSGYSYLSKSIEDVYGISIEEFESDPMAWLKEVHPDDRNRVEKEAEELHEQGIVETEYRIIQPNGEVRWLNDRKYILKDDEGNPTMIGGIASDITDRVKVEKDLKQTYEEMEERIQERTAELTELNVKLQRQQERFLAVFNSFPEVMYVADMETYEVLMVNKAFANILGKDPIGGLCYKEFQGFDSPCDFCTNHIIKEQKGKVYNWEYHNPILERDFFISDKIIKWPDGRDVRFELAIDVTEYKKSEKELEQRAEALTRSNEELERFAYVASHDLQEPLRKIQAFGNRLMIKYSNDLDEKGADYIRRMQNAANRMQNLIGDLLAFSRVNSRAKPFQSVNMKSLMEKVTEDMEPVLAKFGGTIEVQDIPYIEGDFNQIVQLMKNLIDNSIKFHRENVPPHIKISNFVEGDMCRIEVQDNGIGFDEKYLDRIFTIFQRLHGRFEYEGTGVGLAICRRIVERHNGAITAKSSPGEGSTFIVRLPLSQEAK